MPEKDLSNPDNAVQALTEVNTYDPELVMKVLKEIDRAINASSNSPADAKARAGAVLDRLEEAEPDILPRLLVTFTESKFDMKEGDETKVLTREQVTVAQGDPALAKLPMEGALLGQLANKYDDLKAFDFYREKNGALKPAPVDIKVDRSQLEHYRVDEIYFDLRRREAAKTIQEHLPILKSAFKELSGGKDVMDLETLDSARLRIIKDLQDLEPKVKAQPKIDEATLKGIKEKQDLAKAAYELEVYFTELRGNRMKKYELTVKDIDRALQLAKQPTKPHGSTFK